MSRKTPVGIELLRDNHYTTYLSLSEDLDWYDIDKFAFGENPSVFISGTDDRVENDIRVTNRAITVSQDHMRSNTNYINFLYYYSTHSDYSHPDQSAYFDPELKGRIDFADRNLKDKRELILNRYRNAIHFVDGEIARLVKQLKNDGVWDNTILVFTADHGEEFWEENKFGHNSGLNKYQTKVPFLMHIPYRSPQVINKLTSHMDVFQSILEAMQAPTAIQRDFQGESLFSDRKNPLVIGMAHYQRPQKFAILDGNRKSIVDLSDGTFAVESVASLSGGQEDQVNAAKSDIAFLLDQLQQFKKTHAQN